jgi:hypothetical protein
LLGFLQHLFVFSLCLSKSNLLLEFFVVEVALGDAEEFEVLVIDILVGLDYLWPAYLDIPL